ncbi:hypothetical protein ACFL7M_08990 [Thermodesulfobacteriota bacterium]
MKKWFLVITALTIILPVISCGGSKKLPIPSAATSEIYALSETKAVGGIVEVKEVQDRVDFCYIMIYVKSLPGEVTTLNDALDKAKVFTGTFVKSAVKILKRYDINQDVSVWAQLPLKEGGLEVLGHARYDAKRDTFHDFERFKP